MDYSPLWVSLKTASCAIIFTFFLGIFAAWFVISIKNEKLKMILDGVFTLPLVLPPTVLGFILLYIFGIYRPIGKFLIDVFNYKVPFSWSATVIAAVVISFPMMYRSSRSAFEQISPDILDAARTLGMSEWKILWKILLPCCKSGIVGGTILAFTRALGEFGATSMIAGNIAGKTRTLSMAVYLEVASGNFEGAYMYVGILIFIAFISVICINLAIYKEVNKK